MLRIEFALVLLALLIAAVRPSLGNSSFDKWERRFSALAQRRGLSVFLVGLMTLVLRVAVLPIEPIPEPIVHDEFGYLLAADTFSHGRLTNPTHPMWEHFETFAILQKPTYQCFAQPGQGMILALGKVLFGHPFWGVWLSCGLMCAAITWMLQGWLSVEWALLGGVISILRYGVFGYWADSYWGGAVGAIGGALVLGALPRIKQSQRVRDALLMGLGLAILANSRPYEGFVFSMAVALLLIRWISCRSRPSRTTLLSRVIAPLALTLLFTGLGLTYYFYRVTGSPLRMPYQIERATYAVAPYMLWQEPLPEPEYRHAAMRKMYVEEEFVGYRFFHSPAGVMLKMLVGWKFFLGPVLTLPLLLLAVALPRGFRLREVTGSTRELLFVLGISFVSWGLETFYNPHYSAPATGLILAIMLLSTRQLRSWAISGIFLSRAIVIICICSSALRAAAVPLRIPMAEFYEFAWHEKNTPSFGRASIESELERAPGKHLVIVRYKPDHEPFAEWVYNEADIDHAKVVWAREMDDAENHRLVNYFRDRRVWLLEADSFPPKLSKYQGVQLTAP